MDTSVLQHACEAKQRLAKHTKKSNLHGFSVPYAYNLPSYGHLAFFREQFAMSTICGSYDQPIFRRSQLQERKGGFHGKCGRTYGQSCCISSCRSTSYVVQLSSAGRGTRWS